MEYTINVLPNGSLQFIWTDDLADLVNEGQAEIVRASHVEPSDGKWYADMGPSNGPVLSGFAKRSDAIAAEVQWLKDNRGL